MKTVEMSRATGALADYARDVETEPVIVTDHGRPVAALLPIENADRETVALSTNPQFLALIERSRLRQDTEGGISSDDMRRRLQGKPRRPAPGRKGARSRSRNGES
jgi:prevent-host-death family protein